MKSPSGAQGNGTTDQKSTQSDAIHARCWLTQSKAIYAVIEFFCLLVCFHFNITEHLTFKQRTDFSVKGQLEGKIQCTIGPTQRISPTQEQTKQFVLLFCSSLTTMCSLGSPCTLT